MCGIAGIVRLTSHPAPEDVPAVLRINARFDQGADNWGGFQARSLPKPAYRRFFRPTAGSICAPIPISAQAQARSQEPPPLHPRLVSAGAHAISSEDGRLWITWITCNGEVYNYRELRAQLDGHGEPSHSATDTGAILRGYALWTTRW